MSYLLDTNAISDFMNGQPAIGMRLAAVGAGDQLVIRSIVRGEILFGIDHLPSGKRRDELGQIAEKVLGGFPCERIVSSTADRYSALKVRTQRIGVSLNENDLWIAATALLLGATLISRDLDFPRVPGLVVEDWMK